MKTMTDDELKNLWQRTRDKALTELHELLDAAAEGPGGAILRNSVMRGELEGVVQRALISGIEFAIEARRATDIDPTELRGLLH